MQQSDEEEFEAIRKAYPELTRLLQERRDEIVGRVTVERAQLDDQVMTAPGDDADISIIDLSADYFLKLANNHQQELKEIRDAMERMTRGVYGVCESCENPIALERLKKLPYARLCIDCQSSLELGKRAARLLGTPKL
jgi:DnaK suppressor protein